jgi:hypothetical protein
MSLTKSKENLLKANQIQELRSKLSKTSIQMSTFNSLLEDQKSTRLNHTPLSKLE